MRLGGSPNRRQTFPRLWPRLRATRIKCQTRWNFNSHGRVCCTKTWTKFPANLDQSQAPSGSVARVFSVCLAAGNFGWSSNGSRSVALGQRYATCTWFEIEASKELALFICTHMIYTPFYGIDVPDGQACLVLVVKINSRETRRFLSHVWEIFFTSMRPCSETRTCCRNQQTQDLTISSMRIR